MALEHHITCTEISIFSSAQYLKKTLHKKLLMQMIWLENETIYSSFNCQKIPLKIFICTQV